MTNNFCALCADLIEAVLSDDSHIDCTEIARRARAALPGEPAVPEGKKPTRDELWELWLRLNNELPDRPAAVAEFWEHAQIDARARAVRARWGKVAPPADGEVAELVRMLTGIAHWRRRGRPGECDPSPFDIRQADRLDRAAELLERRVPLPVAVSERLPEPSDCAPWPDEPAASAWCWVGSDVDGGWSWEQRSAGCLAAFPDDFTHWLPAHALPLPEVGE